MVSVVIPSYNAENYIERCLDSVISQSYREVEIVVVDDASTDQSLRIVEEYREASANIRIVKHKRNMGLMSTRKDGYREATGNFILFLDADDTLPIGAIERLVEKQILTDADIVMGNLLKHYVDGRTECRRGCLNANQTATRTDVLASLINGRIIHSLCGKLFRAELFRSNELCIYEHLTIAEDACLLYQLVAKAERIASVDTFVYGYYENKGSSSLRSYRAEQIENIIVAYKTIAGVCKPFVQLHSNVEKRLTREIFILYFERLSAHNVRKLLLKHGMLTYGTLSYARKYLSLKDYWFFAKRFVYSRMKKHG